MAKVVKYNGTASERRILKSDFQKVGIEDQDAVTFDSDNEFTAEVSDAAADYMTARDSFEVVEETPQATSKTKKEESKGKS